MCSAALVRANICKFCCIPSTLSFLQRDIILTSQVGVLSKWLLSKGNWTAYFLPLAGFGAVALLVTFFFPSISFFYFLYFGILSIYCNVVLPFWRFSLIVFCRRPVPTSATCSYKRARDSHLLSCQKSKSRQQEVGRSLKKTQRRLLDICSRRIHI